jgi:thiol-disulfide isomerase/thioredoxin
VIGLLEEYGVRLVLVFLLGFVAYSIYLQESGVQRERTAQSFSLPVLGEDTRVSLEESLGKVTVIDFWATYCAPCRESMPWLQQIYDEYSQENLALFSINMDFESNDNVRDERIIQFVQSMDINFPILLDDGRVSQQYGVYQIPHLVIIDRSGVVRYVHSGSASYEEIRREIEGLLDEARG